jgi:hypothetical protein
MFRRILAAALALLTLATAPAFALPAEVARALPGAQPVGAARYQFVGLTLFEAQLWSQSGDFSWQDSFALTLTYRRSFSAEAIAGRALDEMRQRSGEPAAAIEPLRAPLQACFADVSPGDRITGVSTGANSARFYYNGVRRCEIEWPGLRRNFFGIWLDGRNQRAFSAQLRGES